MKGVRGVPGKLLAPIEEGILGIEPEKLCGGLKSDSGVGGADPMGELIAPPEGERAPGLLLLRCWGEPCPLPSPPSATMDPCTDEGAAAGAGEAGAGAASVSLLVLFTRAGDEEGAGGGEPGGGCVGSVELRSRESPAAPPSGGEEGGLDDIDWPCLCVEFGRGARSCALSLSSAN